MATTSSNGSKESDVEKKLRDLSFVLPASTNLDLPFSPVRVDGTRVYISGHVPLNPDGSIRKPLGKVGEDLSIGEAKEAARQTAVAMLASLKNEPKVGGLDNVRWLRVCGMINASPGFKDQSYVMNSFSELIIKLYGQADGNHARSVMSVLDLPYGVPIEIEAEVELKNPVQHTPI